MSTKPAVNIIPGIASNKKGVQITSLRDALKEESKCGFGFDWCDNTLHLPVNNADGSTSYNGKLEAVIVLPDTVTLRITVDGPDGPVVKEITFA